MQDQDGLCSHSLPCSPCSMPSLSPLTEQQRHVLHQHEQQLQQLQQLLTSQPLNPVSMPAGTFYLMSCLMGKPRSREQNLGLPPSHESPAHRAARVMCLFLGSGLLWVE